MRKVYTKGVSLASKGYDEVIKMTQKFNLEAEDIIDEAKIMNAKKKQKKR